eukprot:TRINITY_DN11383_c0_g1_i4.p1 TRINITY_DN11383_c0_g1~~TRINITY_DN11383_c0_g1_i4.p1  ORF type:complete len:270 (+),score=54.94 TRINITY_DN11383_c0_g1_i4:73-882(+)
MCIRDRSKVTIGNKSNDRAEAPGKQLAQLKSDVKQAMSRGQETFIVGGTKDFVPHCVEALLEYNPDADLGKEEIKDEENVFADAKAEPNPFTDEAPKEVQLHKILVVGVLPSIDTDLNEPTTSSKYIWRRVVEDSYFSKSGSRVVLFGTSSLCAKENYDYFTSKGGLIIWLNDIRKSKPAACTQAGLAFAQLLEEHKKDYEYIYVTFSMESVKVNILENVEWNSTWSDCDEWNRRAYRRRSCGDCFIERKRRESKGYGHKRIQSQNCGL